MPAKRRKTTGRNQVQKRSSAGLVIAALAILAVTGATVALARTSAAPSDQAPAADQVTTVAPSTEPLTFGGATLTLVTVQDGIVRLPAADFDDSKARFYAFQGSGKMISFFVLKSSDGVIRAAFDACDVCFASKRGYHQEGDEMVCDNCGSRFPSDQINQVSGGCNPAPLVRTVQGGDVLINAADLEAGALYF
jgi:uncharacterized membrane protein